MVEYALGNHGLFRQVYTPIKLRIVITDADGNISPVFSNLIYRYRWLFVNEN
jgi:hypothetical protein